MNTSPKYPSGSQFPVGQHRGCIVNFDDVFPVQHPSQWGLCWLAGLSLAVLGPLAGIPGIWLSGVVQREVEQAPAIYRGRAVASWTAAISWLGTIVWSAMGAWWLARYLGGVGYALLGIALFLTVFTLIVIARPDILPRRAATVVLPKRAQMGVGSALLVTASILGIAQQQGDRAEQRQQCLDAWEAAQQHQSSKEFSAARADLVRAGTHCTGERHFAITAALAAVDSAARKQQEQRARVARKQLNQRFQRSSSTIEGAIEQAAQHANNQRWERAKEAIDAADAQLSEYARSHVAATAPYRRLAKSLAGERRRVDAQLKKSRLRREALAKAKQDRERLNEERKRARSEAQKRRRQASRQLMCRDGTRSPSCLCSRASRHGCCSHHGGVAGCE